MSSCIVSVIDIPVLAEGVPGPSPLERLQWTIIIISIMVKGGIDFEIVILLLCVNYASIVTRYIKCKDNASIGARNPKSIVIGRMYLYINSDVLKTYSAL